MAVKKLYLIYILEILKKYSDVDHPLTQSDIIRYMEKDYGVECERKAVARNISDLTDLGYEIGYEKGYYLAEREFDDSELRLLIDSVLNSKYIPKNQAKLLIDKLANQSTAYFRKQVRYVSNIDRMERVPNQLFFTIDMLSEAIEKKRKVMFFYTRYDSAGRLVNTTEEKHLVNPYQIAIANGKYYLIGNIDKYDDAAHFRVERIADVEITEDKAKPAEEVEEFRNGLDLPKHMAEHVYMFSGRSELIRLRVSKAGINDCYDWLGQDIYVTEDGDDYQVSLRANPEAIKYWAIQFGSTVEVLEPLWLREETAELAKTIYAKYIRA